MTRVWLPTGRPVAVKTSPCSRVAEYMSTVPTRVPSTDTFAIPQSSHFTLTQLTAVPVKLMVALDPPTFDTAAEPPLQATKSVLLVQVPAKVTEGSVSSKRFGGGAGGGEVPSEVTSKASTTMYPPPLEVVPVTVMTIVWLPDARVGEVNTTSEVSPGVLGAAGPAVSTVVAAPPSMETVAIPQTLHLSPIQLTPVSVKGNVAVAPATFEPTAAPTLNVAILRPCATQAPAGLSVAALSSNRVGGGAIPSDVTSHV